MSWDNPVDRVVLGLEMLREMEQEIVKIMQNLKVAQDRKMIYAFLKRTHNEFKVGDHVYFRVNLRKSSLNPGNHVNLAPKYCGPFEVLDRIGLIADKVAFLSNMRAHNVFHVSLLKRYVHDLPNHLID